MTDIKSYLAETSFNNERTGESGVDVDYKTIKYGLGKYQFDIRLTKDNKFISVDSIKVNKDFLSLEKRIANTHYLDVDQYYEDDEEN
jgi:hypothetical protein